MNFLTWGRNPWGQTSSHSRLVESVLGVAVRRPDVPRRARELHDSVGAPQAQRRLKPTRSKPTHKDLPAKIERHSFMARMFHWVMAASMFTLLFTAFLPIVGVKFAWVQWHWMAGLVLTGSIIYHIIHATFFLDFWSIWVGPNDIPEFKAEMLRELGQRRAGPEVGQVSARQPSLSPGHRRRRPRRRRSPASYDVARAHAALHAQSRTCSRDATWGSTYVAHGARGRRRSSAW